MREVKFTKDFANKKKGEVFKCDGQLASHLVRVDKVAEFTKSKPTKSELDDLN